MSLFFSLMILPFACFMLACAISVKKHAKHDRVLFAFSRLQSAVTKEMLARFDSDELTRQEFESMRFLSTMLDNITAHYNRHKTTMFNLRKMRHIIAQDLQHYEDIRQQMRVRLAEVPADTKIVALYDDFSRAATDAFLAYTPFIRTEIILRLLLGDIATKITAIRQEQKMFGDKLANA